MSENKALRYCFALNQGNLNPKDLVGLKALNLNRLTKSNIAVPGSFVLSGQAFDDFLIANELVEFIVTNLNKVSKSSEYLDTAAREIRGKILSANIPKDIQTQIIAAYKNLSSFTDSYVSVEQSALSIELSEENYHHQIKYYNIKGETALIENIKNVWANLFSSQAISHRLKIEYEGNLSQPVFIQKILNADTSGLIYNFDLETGSVVNSTAVAILGILDHAVDVHLRAPSEADYYLQSKIHPKLLNSILNKQKFMWVRSSQSSEPYTKVKISKLWGERQKLDDTQLRKLNNILNAAESIWAERFVLEWVVDVGTFYIIDFKIIDDSQLPNLATIDWPKNNSQGNILTSNHEAEKDIVKKQLLNFIQKEEPEIRLSDSERDDKASAVSKMFPEVKTVSEVWLGKKIPASEVKVFLNNIDGLGIFTISEVAEILALNSELINLATSKNLQKRICEYLALYLVALAPKPVLIEIERELDLDAQIQILAQLRNLYGHKNFWCVLPELADLSELATYKKNLSASGFRRTTSFRIFQKISQPLYLSALPKIIEQSVDGIILDVDKILEYSLGITIKDGVNEANLDILQSFLTTNLVEKNKLRLYTLFKTSSQAIMDKMLIQLLEVGVNGIFYSHENLYEFKQNLVEQESHILTKSLRKIKKSMQLVK